MYLPFLKKKIANHLIFGDHDVSIHPLLLACQEEIIQQRKGSPYLHGHLNSTPWAQNSTQYNQLWADSLLKSCLLPFLVKSAPSLLTASPLSLASCHFQVLYYSELYCILTSHRLPQFMLFKTLPLPSLYWQDKIKMASCNCGDKEASVKWSYTKFFLACIANAIFSSGFIMNSSLIRLLLWAQFST